MNAMSQNLDHAVAAEQQLLGSILMNNELFDRVSDVLQPEHFLDPVHQRIYTICASRISKGHLSSPIALASVMEGDEGLGQLGGARYLINMAGSAIAPTLIRDYARLILEQSCRRRLREASEEAISGLAGGGESGEVKVALLHALNSLPEESGSESTISLLKAMTKAVAMANEAYQGKGILLETGIPALDGIVRGLGAADVMLLGGCTSMGKTATSLEIAGNVAIRQGKKVAFWSLEMTEEQLATRMASAWSRVPYADVRQAQDMKEDDFRAFCKAAREISEAPMRIIPKNVRDLAAGHAAMRRAARELGGKLDLMVVDYAQLVRAPGRERLQQMVEVSIGLKAIAKMMECPVVALVQIDRKIGERDDKRPQLTDIRETGQFENDADTVVFCHRESYWLERQGPKRDKNGEVTERNKIDWQADCEAVKNVMELIVRKNRHGKIATAQTGFHAPTNRFWQLQHAVTTSEGML